MRNNRLPQSRSTSASKQNTGKGKRRRGERAVFSTVESLELRQMLAVGVLGGDGVLAVKGTTGHDQIVISVNPTNTSEIRVTLNGASSNFPGAKVTTVKVDGDRGDDSIKLDESKGRVTKGMYFLGGAGSDTLVSGTANDALLGGGENDVLYTQGGHNLLNGGDGDDRLFAGAGNDTLVGEGGNDQITDAGGTNTVVGVSRSDIVTTAPLPSTVPTAIGSTSTPTPAPAPAPLPAPGTLPGTPAAPTGLAVTATTSSSITIQWTDAANNETGYKVERSTDGTNFYAFAGTGANGTRVTDSSVSAGKRYYYRVYAINGAGRSGMSGVVSAVPGSTSTPVQPPLSSGGSTSTPAQDAGNPFVIGVWSQPAWSFDKWKGRGINTVVGYESLSGTVSVEAFSKAAVDKGLFMIRHPNADARKDIGQKNLLAWMLNDEPDYHNTPYQTVVNQYNALKAVSKDIPVMVNFSGSSALWHYGNWGEADYKNYLKGADWVSNDLYPVTAHNRPGALDAPGKAVEVLSNWSGGKRQFAVIEASDQQLPGKEYAYPGVNADQFRAEVFNAIISGATGIIYFPQRIGDGFNFDAMNGSVEGEMKKTNARISRIGAALMTQKNPSGVSMDVDGALRVTWRKFNGKTYFVVLNNSNATVSAQMDVRGVSASSATVDSENRTVAIKNGVIGDTFRPYEAHVYVV